MLIMKQIIICCCCYYACYDHESSYQRRKSVLSVSLSCLASGKVGCILLLFFTIRQEIPFRNMMSVVQDALPEVFLSRTAGGFLWHIPISRRPVVAVGPRGGCPVPASHPLMEYHLERCPQWDVHTLPCQTVSQLGVPGGLLLLSPQCWPDYNASLDGVFCRSREQPLGFKELGQQTGH